MMRSRRLPSLNAVALSAILPLAACGAGEESGAAGPEIWTVASVPSVVIGQVEGDPHYLFEQIAGARLLPDGRVVVGDRGSGTIRIFGADGRFEREMGRLGEGPGEFEYINAVALRPPDTVAVYDSGLYRLTRYSADGTLLSTLNIRGEGGRPEMFLGRFESGDMAFAAISLGPRNLGQPSPDVMLLARFGADGLFASTLGTTTGMVRYENGPLPFSPYLHAFVLRDSVYFTDGGDITVLDGKGLVARTIEVPHTGVTYADARARLRARLEALAQAGEDPWSNLERLDAVPEPPSIPDVADVLVDDRGRFWLERYDPGDDSLWLGTSHDGGSWWVLDPDRGLVATVTLPERFVPLDIRADRMVGILIDELDVERVAVLELSIEGN